MTAPVQSEASTGSYTVEPHGDGWAIYRGRDMWHHGFNLGQLTETDAATAEMIEHALNALERARTPRQDADTERHGSNEHDFGRVVLPSQSVRIGEEGAPSVEAAYEMGAMGGPAVEAERLAFEAWMRGHCWALSATWTGTQYRSDAEQDGDFDPRAMQTRRLWAAWRDRAALGRAGGEGRKA